MTFYGLKQKYDSFDFDGYITNVSEETVRRSIDKEVLDDLDFLNLLSPKALNHIETMVQRAHEISVRHFGKSILLYAPLYVSNFCVNNCLYCGFSTNNQIKREVLTFEEIEENCKIISERGIRHILLVTGENKVKTSVDYLKKSVGVLKKYFDGVDVEIYPLDEEGYRELGSAGVDGLTIYQETYNEDLYRILHTKGAKVDYKYRLGACERAGKAEYRNLNVGVLLGLNDFASEIFFAGVHARYLQNRFHCADIGISFPRLRPAKGAYKPKTVISNKNFIQAICAVRLFINRINITISTRESKNLRDSLIPLGITKMSAGSSTEVGGYTKGKSCEGQFEINDMATVEEVKEMIYAKGYQPVMKDWMAL